MSGYLTVNKIFLPNSCINSVYQHLRATGQHGFEGVALLAGIRNENSFYIDTTIIPKQTAYGMEEGLLYSVDADELHRLNVWLYENQKQLIAQVHSHPGMAYHSETDDKYPIVATLGGISIVVPNFAMQAFSLADWAIYRLNENREWKHLQFEEVRNLIIVT